MADIHKGWSRGTIGYRDAQLDSSDFTAAMTLFVAGVPAMVIGSELALEGVGLGQMILVGPVRGADRGPGARSAGKAGGGERCSLRISRDVRRSGRSERCFSASLASGLTIAWAAITLRVAAGWVHASLETWDVSFNDWGVVAIIAVLALAAFLPGPVWAIAQLLRRRVFLVAIVVLLVATWRVLLGSDPISSESASGGFFETVDAVFGLAVLWAIVGGDFGGYGKREEETATGLGYGFVVSGLVFVMAGAALTQRLGGPPTDLLLFGAGTAGAVLALIWVPLMEVDGLGGLNASSTWSIETLVPIIPPRGPFRSGDGSLGGGIRPPRDGRPPIGGGCCAQPGRIRARRASDRRLRDARWGPLRRRTGSMAGGVRLAQSFRVSQLGGRGGGDSLASTEVRCDAGLASDMAGRRARRAAGIVDRLRGGGARLLRDREADLLGYGPCLSVEVLSQSQTPDARRQTLGSRQRIRCRPCVTTVVLGESGIRGVAVRLPAGIEISRSLKAQTTPTDTTNRQQLF